MPTMVSLRREGFVDQVHDCGQTISFCAVNAHHQNGVAEKKIRDLQEAARTTLVHAKQRWPSAITANLWPCAIRMANAVANRAPKLKESTVSPTDMFAQIDVAPVAKHSHAFGSPVCVLAAKAQQGQRMKKWEHKERIGAHLGESPRHSKKVALVLNLQTGHVSPQFHCQHDDLCDTLRPSLQNPGVVSKWQAKTGFHNHKGKIGEGVTDDVFAEGLQIPEFELPESAADLRLSIDTGRENNMPELALSPTGSEISHDDGPMEQNTQQEQQPETRTRSGRVSRETSGMIESQLQQ